MTRKYIHCHGKAFVNARWGQLALRGGGSDADKPEETGSPGLAPVGGFQSSQSAGVGAALSVNNNGDVILSQMVPGMPAANCGAINVGDALVMHGH